ncbi:hypothetical protein [Streptomyces sp. NPDC058773]|uniref:hypothetical protein n=1 Tax=Streptomyces sp. NPDC058773 TaxID=3346632 RepID=UPI0036B3FD27
MVTVLAALVVGVGGTLAVDRTLLSSNAIDDVADICGGTVVSDDVGPVTRNLPRTPAITSSWVDYARDGSLLENCTVSAGRTQVLRVTANLERGSTADWERFTRSQIPGATGPKMTFDAGDRAVSYEKDAAIHVPCTLPRNQPKKDDGTAVTTYVAVVAHAAGEAVENNGKRREDLAYLASQVAEHAHSTMRCKEPLNVPAGAPKMGSTH